MAKNGKTERGEEEVVVTYFKGLFQPRVIT
jgi:hypothetical protein